MMILKIKWANNGRGHGEMTINCEAFFPCSQKDMNLLLKTIDLDWKRKDEILKHMMEFLSDLEAKAKASEETIKAEYPKEFQKMKDLEHLISDCRHPNGVPISKVEMKTAKADLKEQKKLVRDLEQSFKRSSKIAQKAKVNREIIIRKCGVSL